MGPPFYVDKAYLHFASLTVATVIAIAMRTLFNTQFLAALIMLWIGYRGSGIRTIHRALIDTIGKRRLFRWVEWSATADPVPTARPLVGAADEIWVISNYRNLALDHRAYWKNLDQFVPMLLRELADTGKATALFSQDDRLFLDEAHAVRDRRLARLSRLWYFMATAVAIYTGSPRMAF